MATIAKKHGPSLREMEASEMIEHGLEHSAVAAMCWATGKSGWSDSWSFAGWAGTRVSSVCRRI